VSGGSDLGVGLGGQEQDLGDGWALFGSSPMGVFRGLEAGSVLVFFSAMTSYFACMRRGREGGRDLGVTNNKVFVRAGYMGGLPGPWSAASGQWMGGYRQRQTRCVTYWLLFADRTVLSCCLRRLSSASLLRCVAASQIDLY
jgi:hypothetical protein